MRKDPIRELLALMSPPEKKYFRVFASRSMYGSEKNYIRLFDILDAGKQLPAAEIKKKYQNTTGSKNIYEARYYLYNLILKSLHQYHFRINTDAKMAEQLHCCDILRQKGLYGQSMKLLSGIQKTATGREKHFVQIDALWKKIKILQDSYSIHALGTALEPARAAGEDVLRKINVTINYNYLSARMFLAGHRLGVARNAGEIRKLDNLVRHPLMNRLSPGIPFGAKVNYYKILEGYYFLKGNTGNNYLCSRKLYQLIDAHPDYKHTDTGQYLSCLNNYLVGCYVSGRYDELLDNLAVLRSLPQRLNTSLPVNLESRIFARACSLEMSACMDTGRFDRLGGLIKEAESGLKKYDKTIEENYRILLYYLTGYAYFHTGSFDKALSRINRIIHGPDAGVRQDIVGFAYILAPIIHYELGNFDILEYTLRSAYHFLHKKDRLYGVEKIILDFIRNKLGRIPDKKELDKTFRNLKKSLNIITSDPMERKALAYFDFISWLESKISGVPFVEIVRKKTMQNA